MSSSKKNFMSSIFMGNLYMIIPTILVAFLINYAFHQYLLKDIEQKDKMMLYNVQQNIEAFLQDALNTLNHVDLMADISAGGDMDQKLEQINSIDNYFDAIEIVDFNGIVINTLPSNKRQIGYNRRGEDYYAYLSQPGSIFWSTPFISPVSDEPTVILAVKKEDRIIVGYLSLGNLSKLTNKFTEIDSDLKSAILDGYGVYISSFDTDLVLQRQLEPNFQLIRERSSAKWPNEFYRADNEIGLSIKTSNPDWYIIMYDNYEKSMNSIDALLYLFVLLFMLSLVIFVLLTYLRSANINRYIRQFINQTELIAAGRFDIDFQNQKYDEFEKLAENFGIMAENLKIRDQKLEKMAYTDKLTGALNRAYMYNPAWQSQIEEAEVYGLIFLDIDNFKNFNDSYGHTFGDNLLIAVSRKLKAVLSVNTVFSRFGGDEFVIIVPDHKNRLVIHKTIHSIMDVFKKPLIIENRSFFVAVSMGICVGERTGYDFDQMLKAADIAMYQVKTTGKNNYKFYNPEMDKKVKRRLQIEQNLRSALDNSELRLVYQPQLLANSSIIRGFEALLRWENAELGQVSPIEFIPIAEETGMIVPIGEWVFRNACNTIKEINDTNDTDYVMSINVSPIEINHPYFLRSLYDIIEETGIKNEWIEIEITENVFLTNIEEVTTAILHLKLNGISVSLDDFGTGYSSLSYLNKLPIITLKIDREFIRNLKHNKGNQNMVDTIIMLAHKLGIFVIAEGVENQDQVEILHGFSCDCIQGYYFSKPLHPADLAEFIKSSNKPD